MCPELRAVVVAGRLPCCHLAGITGVLGLHARDQGALTRCPQLSTGALAVPSWPVVCMSACLTSILHVAAQPGCRYMSACRLPAVVLHTVSLHCEQAALASVQGSHGSLVL